MGLPWWFSGLDSVLPMQGAQVQSLVRELRSHMAQLRVCMRACLGTLSLSHSPLFATPWTVPTRLLWPWDYPGKNTGVGCHCLLQRIFLTQESNPCLLCLLHWQVGSSSWLSVVKNLCIVPVLIYVLLKQAVIFFNFLFYIGV